MLRTSLVCLLCAWLLGGVDAFSMTTTTGTTTPTWTLSGTTPRPSSRSSALASAAPATIEKTTLDRTTTPDRADAGTALPAFLLRLWNDPYNKREFVARCLAEVCGKNDGESFQIMMQAHQAGMGVIGQYDFEIAELYLQTLKERSLLVDMVPVEDE